MTDEQFKELNEIINDRDNFLDWLGTHYSTTELWEMTDKDKITVRHKFIDETIIEIIHRDK